MIKRTHLTTTHFAVISAILALFAAAIPSRADTTLIREIAKNDNRVTIVVSDSSLNGAAFNVQQAILHHPDNKHQPDAVTVMTMSDLGSGNIPQGPLVILALSSSLPERIPASIQDKLPKNLPQGTDSEADCALAAKGFVVTLIAPDIERVNRLLATVTDRTAPTFRALPFNRVFASNKIALFSSAANRDMAAGWGARHDDNCWDYIEWHSLAEAASLRDNDIPEYHRVFAINRQADDPTPPAASRLLSAMNISPFTIVVARRDDPPHGRDIVFDAPSARILNAKLLRYRTLESVTDSPVIEEAVDLRGLTTSLVLVGDDGDLSDRLRLAIGSRIRSEVESALGIMLTPQQSVPPGGQNGVTLDQLQNSTDLSASLRAKSGLRYVWLYSVHFSKGRTEYSNEAKRITPDPAPFTEAEPARPSDRVSTGLFKDRAKTDDEKARDNAQYAKDHDRWQKDADDYKRQVSHTSVQWQQTVTQHCSASIRGTLYLIDLKTAGSIAWQHDFKARRTTDTTYRSETRLVRGFVDRPANLSAPENSDTCPDELRIESAREAASDALAAFTEHALTPDVPVYAPDRGDDTPEVITPPATPDLGAPAATRVPKVAAIDGNVVTITFGKADGVTVGDEVHVGLTFKDITDPDTGKVIDHRVATGVWLHVTSVGATSDCAPDSPADAANVATIKVGMECVLPKPPTLH